MEKRRLNVVDIDGTLLREHLVFKWFRALIRAKQLSADAYCAAEEAERAHRSREGSFDAYASEVVKILKSGLKGVSERASFRIGRRIVEEHQKHAHVFLREILAAATECGVLTAAVSGSPIQTVQPIAEFYRIQEIFATTFVSVNGHLTGELADDWIENNGKGRAVDALATRFNLDLKESIAIGDTISDAGMLEKVGYPICFNPSRALLVEAKKRHWPIVIERKDACTILTWYGHTQKHQLCETPNPIVPYDLRSAFLPRFKAHFG